MAFGDIVQGPYTNSASAAAACGITLGAAPTLGNLIVLLHYTGDGAASAGSGLTQSLLMVDGTRTQAAQVLSRVVQAGDGQYWEGLSDFNDDHVVIGYEIEGPFDAATVAGVTAQNGGNPLTSPATIYSGTTGATTQPAVAFAIFSAVGSGWTASYDSGFTDAGNATLASQLTVMGAKNLVAGGATTSVTATMTSGTPSFGMGGIATFYKKVRSEQEGSRARNDDGTEATATWKAAQDTDIVAASGTAVRVRITLNGQADLASKRVGLGYKVNNGQLREAH